MKTGDHILDHMLKQGLPLTIKTYVHLDTQSDSTTRDDLSLESRSKLSELIALGWLHDEDTELVQ